MESAKDQAKNIPGGGDLTQIVGQAITSVDGIGDKAAILPAGQSIMVLKGDSFFVIGFQQFVPGREKTAALAKIVAGRL